MAIISSPISINPVNMVWVCSSLIRDTKTPKNEQMESD